VKNLAKNKLKGRINCWIGSRHRLTRSSF
jgi:hypothetical protein